MDLLRSVLHTYRGNGGADGFTFASQLENGIPLSRANAKSCREVDAYELIVITIKSRRMTTANPVAPAADPVAF